jgi:hypothetical protein
MIRGGASDAVEAAVDVGRGSVLDQRLECIARLPEPLAPHSGIATGLFQRHRRTQQRHGVFGQIGVERLAERGSIRRQHAIAPDDGAGFAAGQQPAAHACAADAGDEAGELLNRLQGQAPPRMRALQIARGPEF